MKNAECIIYLRWKNGVQTFKKEKDGWIQISSRGIVRHCTAEQVLSHLLPALINKRITVEVKKRCAE